MHEAAPGKRDRVRAGVASACACYFLWGLVPLFWKQLASVGALELIAHRTVWSLVFLGLLLLGMPRARGEVRDALTCWGSLCRMGLGAVLLTINWLAYVWGVNHGRIVETSLGYFLVPLFSVVAGRILLHEHLQRVQAAAVGIEALGVGGMVILAGGVPWIALALAGSWSLYSVLRKKAKVGPVPGLAIETLVMTPFAASYVVWVRATAPVPWAASTPPATPCCSPPVSSGPCRCFSLRTPRRASAFPPWACSSTSRRPCNCSSASPSIASRCPPHASRASP